MTTFSEDLLRKYNKDKQKETYVPATTIATTSYANMYDALYERFRDNRNFSTEAWNQAIKLGKQDTYFALLEKNKDVDMSDEFYDHLYYNYEGTMLELYKTSADNNKVKEYFVEKYDPQTNKYIQESIGEMTDSQYIQYQLDNLREAQSVKIARDLEEQRKQNMSGLAKVANTAGAVVAEFGEGVTTGITGILDFALGLGWATGAAIDGKNWLDSYVDYFGTKGLTAQSKATFRASLDEWERKNTFIRNIDGEMEPVGKYLAGISNSIGMMVPAIVTNMIAPGAGMPLFYSSIYTNNLYENANNPDTKNSPSWVKVTNAAAKTAVEVVIEWGLGKVLGGTVQNKMLGLTGKFGTASVLKPLGKLAGAKYLAKSALQEGLEEFLQDFSTNLVDQFTGMRYEGYQNTGVNFQTLIDSLVIGALSSLVMSGGKIAQNSISNRIAKTTDGKYGTAYPVIETKDGKLENIRGAKQLAWSDMMSDFMAALDTLKNGKVDINKNLGLAEEVYGGVTILTQLYSSFDADRIKNSEKLLQRLAKSEQTAKENAMRIVEGKAKMKDGDYTDIEIQFAKEYSKQIRNRDKEDFKDIRVEFANKLEGDVKDMLGGVYSRYAKRITKAILENAEKLKENGVTEVVSVTSEEYKVKKDPAVTELDNILQGKNDALLGDYEFIFGTDGHVAIEVDKMLFVPVAWLENYEVSEIYEYLAQEQLLSYLLDEKDFTGLIDKLVEHNKEFTKNENVTRERALMDLFFNESVFQHFLLSESGKNLHEFKNLIFTLFSSIKFLGNKGTQLNNILEDIKQTWNKPLLKAIINWNMDMQKLGADILLSDADKAFINKYQVRKRMSVTAANGGAISSEHRRVARDLLERGEYTAEEKALIRHGLTDTESIKASVKRKRKTRKKFTETQKNTFYDIVNTLDNIPGNVSPDVENGVEFALDLDAFYGKYTHLREWVEGAGERDSITLGEAKTAKEESLRFLYQEVYQKYYDGSYQDFLETPLFFARTMDTDKVTDSPLNSISMEYSLEELPIFGTNGFVYYGMVWPEQLEVYLPLSYNEGLVKSETFTKQKPISYNMTEENLRTTLRQSFEALSPTTNDRLKAIMLLNLADDRYVNLDDKEENSFSGAFVLPPQAFSTSMEMAAITQRKADAINEFEKTYGISARALLLSDVTTLSRAQQNKIQQDMEILHVDNIFDFVLRKLEVLLGDEYIVTPTYDVIPSMVVDENGEIWDIETVIDEVSKFDRHFEKEKKDIIKLLIKNLEMFDTNETKEIIEKIRSMKIEEVEFYVLKNRVKLLQLEKQFLERPLKLEQGSILSPRDFEIVKKIPADQLLVSNIVNPPSGTQNEAFLNMFEKTDEGYTPRRLGDFLQTETNEHFSDWTVEIINDSSERSLAYASIFTKTIAINLAYSEDYMYSFVHEMNHVIQFEYKLSRGFASWRAEKMPKLLEYVAKNYRELIVYYLRRDGRTIDADILAEENNIIVSERFVYAGPYALYIKPIVAYIAYRLVQGEAWAEHHIHNGKPVKAFSMLQDANGSSYLISPDGKERFEIPGLIPVSPARQIEARPDENNIDTLSTYARGDIVTWKPEYSDSGDDKFLFIVLEDRGQQFLYETRNLDGSLFGSFGKTGVSDKSWVKTRKQGNTDKRADEIQIGNALARQFDEILGVRAAGYDNDMDTRNTYHARLSRKSASELIQSIINKALPMSVRAKVTIDEIILNPEQYLSQEILDYITERGDNEGSVYHGLKQWFEDNIEGVSIDRDNVTHEYIFVDDNAFDDTLTPELSNRIHDDNNNDLVTKYTSEDGIGLNRFYKLLQLSLLGLPSNIKVVINDKVVSETVIDKNNRQGLITIHVDKNTTNAEFIDTLNHEFRHLLQYYSGFETGFTPKFVVTKKMLADIKKHVPEIFNKETRAWAKLNGSQDTDTFIAQRFVYYMIGGEQNAYGFKSAWLNAKPAFVTKEAGRPTIFMPWYDAKTGEGRYTTDFLASRAETGKGIEIPRVDRKPKYKKLEIIDKGDEGIERKYTYERDRFFNLEKAKGTNLEGFKQDMAPDLQDFIIATTGNEDKLPKELRYAIKKKALTEQALFKYFREADAKDINQFTFDLINKYMFKNSTISSMEELDRLVSLGTTKFGKGGLAYWWAASIVLRKEGLAIESLVKENSVDSFVNFMSSLEGSQWEKKIERRMEDFDWYFVQNKNGKMVRKEIGMDQASADYMRVFAMKFFDGSLSGAFYTARTLRRKVRLYQDMPKEGELDRTIGEDGNLSAIDLVTETGFIEDDKQYGNDIIAMYEADILYKSTDEMIVDLVRAARPIVQKRATELVKRKTDITEEQRKKLVIKLVNENLLKYGAELLNKMSPEDVAIRYEHLRIAEMTGLQSRVDITDTRVDLGEKKRVNVVACIKRYGTNIIKFVSQGKVVWKNLPAEVRDMFEETTETVKGKKVVIRKLKAEVYSVGHVKGKGVGRVASDMTQILKNKDLLRQVSYDAKRDVFASKETTKEVEVLQRKVDKTTRELLDAKGEIKTLKRQGKMRAAEFDVRGRKSKISDTPNNFTVVSPIQMPTILYKIFDVSFAEMANNEVVFASIDKDGNLLTEETDRKKFDSALKHEVTNWDAFYEATRPFLLELTRNDVLDIVEFIHNGLATTDGPAGKLAAFQIFVLGYIYDGAKRNINNWNFSDAEIDVIRKLYEGKASEHGSGLNAVGQMLKVIDPMKKVRQRMLDDYGITDAELAPLFTAVDNLQAEKDLARRKEKALEVADLLRDIELKMAEGDKRKKGFGKRWYQKMKSTRYTFMLSSPTTWIRNIVSNIVVEEFNKGSDVVGKFVFKSIGKKAYREGQWDLASTKTSTEVYQFIEDNVKNSELFDFLYDGSTKYDDRAKDVVKQKDLFVTMITRALERKYAAENRFDNKTANNIAKFVSRMISDKRFIKKAAGRYLGKILTLEVERGNVSLDDGFSNKVLDLFAEAVVLANEDYMHKRSFVADMVDSLKEKHPFWYETLTWWQPFLNSSFNWFQEFLKYTPVGLVGAIYKMSTLEKQITKMDERRAKGELVTGSKATEYLIRRDVGKGIIGLGLLTLGIVLAAVGMIRIDEEDDKFYIKAGNIKIDISNIFGTSSILIGASLAQIGKKDFDDIMKYVAENMFEGFMLKDMLDRHRWDKGFYEGLLTETESILRSFVPQIVQLMIRSTNNKKIRYSPGMKGMWERWLNGWVPTQPFGERKVNPYTGEAETKYAIPFVGELMSKGILGPRLFWTEVDELEAFAKEYGVKKNEINPEITINGEKVSLGDKGKLNEYYGKLNKKSLAELPVQRHYVQMPNGSFKTLSWSQMDEAQRARVIDRTMIQNSEFAKIYTWTQVMNNKYQADSNSWKTLRDMGITKNVYRGEKGFVKQK